MTDSECVAFLQWALPRLGLRWRGFRRVRRQVGRRIARRIVELGLPDPAAYRAYLEHHAEEWTRLDALCHIPISRFRRDAPVWDALRDPVLPALEELAAARRETWLRCWSVGCASGEEPYSLVLLWRLERRRRHGRLALHVTATDVDAHLLERARRACYEPSSLKEVPGTWRAAFEPRDGQLCLRPAYRGGSDLELVFVRQDVRREAPAGLFHLVLCRNLAFTYFEDALQARVLETLRGRLVGGGALAIGLHEALPAGASGFAPWGVHRAILRRID